jgi:hypothetical protein
LKRNPAHRLVVLIALLSITSIYQLQTSTTGAAQQSLTVSGTMFFINVRICPAQQASCVPTKYYFLQANGTNLYGLIFPTGELNIANGTYATVGGVFYPAASTCRSCVVGNIYVKQLILSTVVTYPNSETVTTTIEFNTNYSSTQYNYTGKPTSTTPPNAGAISAPSITVAVIAVVTVGILCAILLRRQSKIGRWRGHFRIVFSLVLYDCRRLFIQSLEGCGFSCSLCWSQHGGLLDFVYGSSVSNRMQDNALLMDLVDESILTDPERKQTFQLSVQRLSTKWLIFEGQNLLTDSAL